MSGNKLLEEIEQLRDEMERRGRDAALNSRELLQISERLDLLINKHQRQEAGSKKKAKAASKKGLRLSRRRLKI
jgi:hypothetical protein